jgi:hypothetical protein
VRFTIRWDRIVGALILGLVVVVMLAWGFYSVEPMPAEPASSSAVVNDDHGGLPRCTDAIADAGGVCWGEPLPPCPTEDSDNCYWDGGANGLGRSFYTEDGQTVWLDAEEINK